MLQGLEHAFKLLKNETETFFKTVMSEVLGLPTDVVNQITKSE